MRGTVVRFKAEDANPGIFNGEPTDTGLLVGMVVAWYALSSGVVTEWEVEVDSGYIGRSGNVPCSFRHMETPLNAERYYVKPEHMEILSAETDPLKVAPLHVN